MVVIRAVLARLRCAQVLLEESDRTAVAEARDRLVRLVCFINQDPEGWRAMIVSLCARGQSSGSIDRHVRTL